MRSTARHSARTVLAWSPYPTMRPRALWNAKTGAALAVLSGHQDRVVSAAFSPDGSHLVTAAYDNTARVWDVRSGALLTTLSGHTGWVNSAEFSPDGSRIVTASFDNSARLWDARTGAAIATLAGHTDRVISAAFSPDGSRVVTASADKTARLWDGKTGAAAGYTRGPRGLGEWRRVQPGRFPHRHGVVRHDRATVGRARRALPWPRSPGIRIGCSVPRSARTVRSSSRRLRTTPHACGTPRRVSL